MLIGRGQTRKELVFNNNRILCEYFCKLYTVLKYLSGHGCYPFKGGDSVVVVVVVCGGGGVRSFVFFGYGFL